jgi:hypothetical protein
VLLVVVVSLTTAVRVTVSFSTTVVGLAVNAVAVASSPVPLSDTLCIELATFNASSVTTTEPLVLPAAVGVKSTASVQDAPEASVEVEDDVLNCGHVAAVFSAKPIEMLGFVPVVGVARVSALLPMFEIVAVCGPSVVSVDPTLVAVAKRRLLALTSTLRMRLLESEI